MPQQSDIIYTLHAKCKIIVTCDTCQVIVFKSSIKVLDKFSNLSVISKTYLNFIFYSKIVNWKDFIL